MNIQFTIGNETVALQSDNQNFMLAKPRTRTNKETGEQSVEWEGFSFHASVEHCLNKLLALKIRASEATSLKELKADIEQARSEIREQWGLVV